MCIHVYSLAIVVNIVEGLYYHTDFQNCFFLSSPKLVSFRRSPYLLSSFSEHFSIQRLHHGSVNDPCVALLGSAAVSMQIEEKYIVDILNTS